MPSPTRAVRTLPEIHPAPVVRTPRLAEFGFDILPDPGIGPMIRAVERRIACATAGADLRRAVALVSAPPGAGFSPARGPAEAICGPRSNRGNPMATKKAAKKKSRRTVMYSSGGKKLYAVRAADGKFKDIQQYSRAHAADIRAGSSAETKAAAKKAAKKAAGKASSARTAVAKKVTTAKKAVTKKAAAVKKAVAKKVAKPAAAARGAVAKAVKSVKRALKKVAG
jgi:hypothetical protein